MHKLFLLAVAALLLPASFAQKAVPYFTEPSVAPNRAEIAFVSGGDIWTAPLSGGEAHLLVAHPANETRPIYSPDGTGLAFVSNRTGNGDLYVLNLNTGALQRITFDDAAEQLDGWSRDGKFLYFSSSAQEVAGMNDIFRISAEGGMPVAVTADRYVNEFFSAPSPDGKSLAFTAHGNTSSQWWRHGHSHLDESEIWLATFTPAPKYEKLAGGDFKCLWPMWSADGARVYFMSDQGGAENLWETRLKGGAPRQVTQFHDGRVLWPSISYDGKTIVFERDFGIWKLDTATGKAAPIEITRRGAAGTPEVNHLSLTSQFRDLVLAPDGRKLAFTAHGEMFAAAAHEAGTAARVTHTTANENQIAWCSRRQPTRPGRRRASRTPRPTKIKSRGRRTAGGWRTYRTATAPIVYIFTISLAAPRRASPATRALKPLPCGAATGNCSPSCATASNCACTMPRANRSAPWLPDAFRGLRSAPTASMPGRPTTSGLLTSQPAIAALKTCSWRRPPAEHRARSVSSPIPTAAPCSGRPMERIFCSTPTNGPRTTISRASTWC